MYIEIPTTKRRINSYDCARKALAAYLEKKRCSFREVDMKKYDIQVQEEYVYYPYWIASVWTCKDRALPIYPAKEIVYYVVTDGRDGNFIVLRNIPKTESISAEGCELLAARISQKKLMADIVDDAIEHRINKQFIFGAPQARKQSCRQMYLPMVKVRVKRKGYQSYKDYYVNIYTGEVKQYA